MKRSIIIAVAISISMNAFSQTQIMNKKEQVKKNFRTLGITKQEEKDRANGSYQSGDAYWNVPKIISAFSDSSATREQLTKFLINKKNAGLVESVFGSPITIMAIEPGGITDFFIDSGKIVSIEHKPATAYNLFYLNNVLFMRK